MIRFILIYLILGFLNNIFAASTIDNKIVDEFRLYLQGIKLIAVDFTQIDSGGLEAEGKLLIEKPYKFRCNYYPPFPLVIIGNTNYVSVYDYEMEQISRMKSSENIFNFLLSDEVEFDKHFVFKEAIDDSESLKISLFHKLTERLSSLSLDKKTKQLKRMEIFEGDNIITIYFHNITRVSKFDSDLFTIKNPDIYGPPARLTKTELEKKFTFN